MTGRHALDLRDARAQIGKGVRQGHRTAETRWDEIRSLSVRAKGTIESTGFCSLYVLC